MLVLGVISAEPPRFRQFGRQTADVPAPYPPSGWKPQGDRLILPQRQTQASQKYGAPSPSYGPPSPSYGPPTEATDPENTTDSATEPDAEEVSTEVSLDVFKRDFTAFQKLSSSL